LNFVRIRHYGFLANRVCQEKLALCRSLLGVDTTSEPLSAQEEPVEGQSTGDVCPSCGKGRMVIVEIFEPTPPHQTEEVWATTLEQAGFDTS
jgi:hypothetical protein